MFLTFNPLYVPVVLEKRLLNILLSLVTSFLLKDSKPLFFPTISLLYFKSLKSLKNFFSGLCL